VTDRFPRIAPLGDAAVTVTFANEADETSRGLVLSLRTELARRPLPGTIELVAATTTLTVHYDPLESDYPLIKEALAARLPGIAKVAVAPAGTLHEIPVRYDGADLADVASLTGLSAEEVVRRHSAAVYQVLLLGFVPGFAYLGFLDPALVLPRRARPRERVPAGSVAIAGAQTGVYPAATPGGWHLIGRTELRLFDPARSPAALLATGDQVRFIPADP
jgi:5-oxoprolinase (ATP-hydrolysing) subunit B